MSNATINDIEGLIEYLKDIQQPEDSKEWAERCINWIKEQLKMIDPVIVMGQGLIDEALEDIAENYKDEIAANGIDTSLSPKEQGRELMNMVNNWDFDGDGSIAWTNGWIAGMEYMLRKLT